MPLNLNQTKPKIKPRADLAELVFIMDISGSMGGMEEAAVSGFNKFVRDQKKAEGEAKLTLIFFDDQYEIRHNRIPIKDVPEMTAKDYVPRGQTALRDAIGRAVSETTTALNKLPDEEKPGKIMFSIFTDGDENASEEYTDEKIREIMKLKQDKQKWQFLFMSSDLKAVETAGSYGISKNLTRSVNTGRAGMVNAFHSASLDNMNYRSSMDSCVNYEEEDDG